MLDGLYPGELIGGLACPLVRQLLQRIGFLLVVIATEGQPGAQTLAHLGSPVPIIDAAL